MDVHEDPKANVVTATFELPGLKKEDVNVDVHNSLLTISGESKVSTEHEESGYAVRERRFGKFSRSIPLPEGVKACRPTPFLSQSHVLNYCHHTERADQSVFGQRGLDCQFPQVHS